jgi:Nucleotidyl transferase AbiEii toxin, Type IV TA system
MHRSEYDTSAANMVLGQAALILKAIGFAAKHVVLIGGSVPGLLVPELDPAIEPHIGTTDLDFCLSMAIVEGETAEYERIETALKQAGFEPEESWRWRGGPHGHVIVEFFCPAGPGREAGKLFRPKVRDNPTAKHNFGASLSALALDAGGLISRDVVVVTREVELPAGMGKQTMELRVTGVAAFLAAKADALRQRDKPKDAYDVVWLLEAWPDGPSGAAAAVCTSSVFGLPEMERALATLEDQFLDIDRAGARAYARFLLEDGGDADLLARRAVGAVTEFLRTLRDSLR